MIDGVVSGINVRMMPKNPKEEGSVRVSKAFFLVEVVGGVAGVHPQPAPVATRPLRCGRKSKRNSKHHNPTTLIDTLRLSNEVAIRTSGHHTKPGPLQQLHVKYFVAVKKPPSVV